MAQNAKMAARRHSSVRAVSTMAHGWERPRVLESSDLGTRGRQREPWLSCAALYWLLLGSVAFFSAKDHTSYVAHAEMQDKIVSAKLPW